MVMVVDDELIDGAQELVLGVRRRARTYPSVVAGLGSPAVGAFRSAGPLLSVPLGWLPVRIHIRR